MKQNIAPLNPSSIRDKMYILENIRDYILKDYFADFK
jgi:hypothetical protein